MRIRRLPSSTSLSGGLRSNQVIPITRNIRMNPTNVSVMTISKARLAWLTVDHMYRKQVRSCMCESTIYTSGKHVIEIPGRFAQCFRFTLVNLVCILNILQGIGISSYQAISHISLQKLIKSNHRPVSQFSITDRMACTLLFISSSEYVPIAVNAAVRAVSSSCVFFDSSLFLPPPVQVPGLCKTHIPLPPCPGPSHQ